MISLPSLLIPCIAYLLLSLTSPLHLHVSVSAISSLANDIEAMNYIRTLELLESNFMFDGLNKFTATDFQSIGLSPTDYSYFHLIRDHETSHAQALASAIVAAGGTPVSPCQYNFVNVLANVTSFIQTLQAFETLAVSAFDGVIDTVTNPVLIELLATISTVEARHASYVQVLNRAIPYPNTFDPAFPPSTPISMAQQFIVAGSCTTNVAAQLPVPRNETTGYSFPFNGTTDDIITLNYALGLEHMEAHFYNTYQPKFDANAFAAAGFSNLTRTFITLIQSHENAHVQTLTTVIQQLGGTPVPPCTYNFGNISTVQQYLALARALENTGTSAYDGAADTLSSVALQQASQTIATVEARQSAFLNLLNNIAPFNASQDNALNSTSVIAIASGFRSCPYTIVGPAQPFGVVLNATSF